MSETPFFDADLSIVITRQEIEERRSEIFREAIETSFLEWLCRRDLSSLLNNVVRDVVSWFDLREDDNAGDSSATSSSIARLYFVERKSVGFVVMQIIKHQKAMYRLPLTRTDWFDFVSLVNQRDTDAYDKILDLVIDKAQLVGRVRNGVLWKRWLLQEQHRENRDLIRGVVELLLMIRLGFEKGLSRPDLRPGASKFESKTPAAYDRPPIDLKPSNRHTIRDMDVVGRMLFGFPRRNQITLRVDGDIEDEIRRYIIKAIELLQPKQLKDFSDDKKINRALTARGRDPATMPTYKHAIAFPKTVPFGDKEIVRLEDYLEYGFGMSASGASTVFGEFIERVNGLIDMDVRTFFGSKAQQLVRTRSLVRSVIGFSQHEEFVGILQRYIEQAIDNNDFGRDVSRFKHDATATK
ncbi:MAG: hypothetical protein P8P91_04610 [Pseudomonadales bacterium]|nr:hypothetical protein [Pseudomonadales bacterium]